MDNEIQQAFENWRNSSNRYVNIYNWKLENQAQGYMIAVEIYDITKYNPEYSIESQYFFGDTIMDCINAVNAEVSQRKQKIIDGLTD